jgi:hypothetical protein
MESQVKEEREGRSRISFIGDVSTRALVVGVLLGVLMPVLQQVTERLDTILFGGAYTIFGIIVANTVGFIAVASFGFVVGLIAEEINPFVAVATGTSPVAVFFFFTNAAQVLGLRLMQVWLGKTASQLTFKDALYMSLFATFLNTLVFLPVQLFYLQLEWTVIIPLTIVNYLTGALIPPFIGLPVVRALIRAGLVRG